MQIHSFMLMNKGAGRNFFKGGQATYPLSTGSNKNCSCNQGFAKRLELNIKMILFNPAVVPWGQYDPNLFCCDTMSSMLPQPIYYYFVFFYSSLMGTPTAANLFPILFFSENFALYWLGSCYYLGNEIVFMFCRLFFD